MFKAIRINNYRGFERVLLSELTEVNLITGRNNVGKTAALEAFWALAAEANPVPFLSTNANRGLEIFRVDPGRPEDSPWDSLFYEFDSKREILFEARVDGAGISQTSIKVLRDQNAV